MELSKPLMGLSLFSKFLCITLSVILCMGFAGCSSIKSGDKASDSASDLKKITLVLDYTPNTNHAGIYIAKAKGLFEKQGLDVDIQQPPEDGADALVAAGKAEFGVSFQDWMASYLGSDNPLPVTAVGAILQHNTSSILSLRSEGINSPKDMTGKSYGSMDVDTELAILKTLVNNDGGNWDNVKVLPGAATDEVQGLSSHAYDSIWSYEGWGVINTRLNGFDTQSFKIADIDPVFDYYTPLVISNNDFLQNNPNVAKSFMSALAEGYKYAATNIDDSTEILCSVVPELNRGLVYESLNYLKDYYLDEDSEWGKFDENRWSAFYEWMNSVNLTEKPLDVKTGFTNKYL